MYRIQCVNNHSLYWANEQGWVDIEDADLFTGGEMETMSLPVEGQWIEGQFYYSQDLQV